MSALHCPRGMCGERLRPTTDGQGHSLWVCDACERNRLGLCRDCPAPIPDRRAHRCLRCRTKHKKALARANEAKRWADREWAARRRAQQRAYNQRPEVKAKKAAYKRAWGAADPTYMRVAAKKYRASAKGRKAVRRGNRRYAERHAEQVRAYKRDYYQRNRETIRARQNAAARAQRERKRQVQA